MYRIDRDTKGFGWLLADESHVCYSEGNSDMIRELIKAHNAMYDYIESLEDKVREIERRFNVY